MTHSAFPKSLRSFLSLVLVAGAFSSLSLARADDSKKKLPAPAPKVATKPATLPPKNTAPVNRPGTGVNTGRPGANTTPSANHPSANGANTTVNRPNTTTNVRPPTTTPAKVTGPIHTIAPAGSQTRITPSGNALRTRPNGSVSDVHNAKLGMDVHNNIGGGRTVRVERPDHSVVFAQRGRPGFVQHPYAFHGHDYAVRTYAYHGHVYNRYYSRYEYRGIGLSVYAPGYYYRPGFYGWAYNPWAAPIAYGWGWGAAPWYGQYGYYFQPYPVYPSAAFWLTDYLISQDLQAAYAARQAAAEAASAPPADASAGGQPAQPVLTPEVKQAIADEVKSQIALENSEAAQNTASQPVDPASSGIARLLSDGRPHTFVAGGHLDVTDESGKECVVSDGDTLQLRQPPPEDATVAKLVVMSSKGLPECDISLTVQVTLADLQEMQNHMRETIDKGMAELQSKQGSNGLPPAPDSAQGAAAPAAYAAIAPPPDPNAATEIQAESAKANDAEKDVSNEAATQAPGTGALQPAPAVAPTQPPPATN